FAPGAGAPTVQSTPRRHAATGISCRSTAPGAKTDPSQNPEPPPNRTRGGCSYGSEYAPANTPLWAFHVGAPPPVRKRSPVRTPSQPQSHPRRVLLRFRACPGLLAAAGFLCRSTAPGAKTEPSQNPEPPPIAPGADAPTAGNSGR